MRDPVNILSKKFISKEGFVGGKLTKTGKYKGRTPREYVSNDKEVESYSSMNPRSGVDKGKETRISRENNEKKIPENEGNDIHSG